MKKILLNFALFFAILFSLNLPSFAVEFTDLKEDYWAFKYIELLATDEVVVGYPDGSFQPDAPITRAEFATMVIKALNQENAKIDTKIDFSDVTKDYWAYNMIERAVHFDLIKNAKGETFRPNDNVSRAEVLSVVINSLTTDNLSVEEAKAILKERFTDYAQIPEWIIVPAGKAHKLDIIVFLPNNDLEFEATRPATRAEVSAFLFKMIEQVKLNPNKKLKEVLPKIGEGIVIKGVKMDGNIATIPAGTIIPVVSSENLSSQTSKLGELFLSKLPNNLISEKKYMLFDKDNTVAGRVLDVKKSMFIIRNGKLIIETKTIKTINDQVAAFEGVADTDLKIKGFWQKIVNFLFKNAKVTVKNGQLVDIMLLKDVKVDVTNGWIIE